MTNLYCARCGTQTVPGERSCGKCGNDLTMPDSVTNAPPLPQGIPPTTPPIQPPPVDPQPVQPTAPIYQQGYGTASVKPKGGSPLPIIIGLVVLLVVLGLGGYFLFLNKGNSGNQALANPTSPPAIAAPSPTTVAQANQTTPANSDQATPTAQSNSNQITPTEDNSAPATPTAGSAADTALRQEISDATDTMNGLNSFHAVAQTTVSDTNLTLDGDFSASGSQFKGERNGQPFAAIYISQTGYISSDGGKTWQTDTTDTANYADNIFTLFNGFSFSTTDVVSDSGQETLSGGLQAHKVNLNDDANNLAVTFWIIDNNGKKTVARVSIVDSSTNNNITVDYSKFSEAVNVTAPPVTDSGTPTP